MKKKDKTVSPKADDQKVEKSETTEELIGDNLQKSIDKLEEFAQTDDPVSRKDALLAKAVEGDLEKSERDELFQLLGGNPIDDEDKIAKSVGEELVKSMTDDATQGMQDALDVSPYLRDQHDAMVKSLNAVGEHIEKSDKRQHEYNLIHARALVDMGNLVKSMSERLGVIEVQPVRGPKSKGITPDQTLNKSFGDGGGENNGDEQLTKGQITEALDGLMQESMEKGMNGMTVNGGDILLEISKFEQTSTISPNMHREVKGFLGRRNAAH